MLAFGNVLAVTLAHSGKMWMLSMLLGVASFVYLYRALTEEAPRSPGKYAAVSIIAAFLATSNFAFAGVFLIAIPILLYAFPRTYDVAKRIVAMTLCGAAAFLALFALNAANIIGQVSGFAAQLVGAAPVARVGESLTLLESFRVNARQAIEAFPLLLLALVPALRAGVRDRRLAGLAALYAALWIIAVSVVFRSDDGLALNVRHIFPVGFFLMFFLAACTPPARWASLSLGILGVAAYAYILVLLSVPTTYNAAYDFAIERYGTSQIRIDENIFELTLPMNQASYALFKDASCGSTCQYMRRMPDDIPFRPVVVTGESDPAAVRALPPPDLLVTAQTVPGCVPIARFGNDVPDDEVFDIDINLGRMLMPSFYQLTRLGKNIYLYDARTCDASAQQSFFLTDPNIFGLTPERGAVASS